MDKSTYWEAINLDKNIPFNSLPLHNMEVLF